MRCRFDMSLIASGIFSMDQYTSFLCSSSYLQQDSYYTIDFYSLIYYCTIQGIKICASDSILIKGAYVQTICIYKLLILSTKSNQRCMVITTLYYVFKPFLWEV